MQRRNVALQRAVGLNGDEAALGAQTTALGGDDLNVLGVDLRHNHGHIGSKAVCAVVGYHRALGLGVSLFQSANLVLLHVDGAEHKVNLRGDLFHMGSVQHHQLLGGLRHGGAHHPMAAHRILIGFTCRAGRSGHRGQMEPGVVLQQGNKPLADHAGRAHNAYTILFHFATFLSTPRRPAGLTIPAAQPPWPKDLCLFSILCGKRPRRPPHREQPKRNSPPFYRLCCNAPARTAEKTAEPGENICIQAIKKPA